MKPVSFIRADESLLQSASSASCTESRSALAEAPAHGEMGVYKNPLSLDALLVQHPHATYFVQVGMSEDVLIQENPYLGVRTGDILLVDRVCEPRVGSLVLAVCEGELLLCRYTEHEGKSFLVCGTKDTRPVELLPGSDVSVWGVVSALSRRL
jgi:DNA polymerase V